MDLEKEICAELRKQVPTLENHSDDFIKNYIGFYPKAMELCCNKGLNIKDAVKHSMETF